MSVFMVSLDTTQSGRTLHDGVNSMIVFADDADSALEAAQAEYPGLTTWEGAQATDLSLLDTGVVADPEADPPVEAVDPETGVWLKFRKA